ncbi:MAG: hypothetical protein KatS3mg005_3148 [Bryobacteraceae bacterium]|nr:MAG: hypothetical protein KatS3mg005_3148 [Bryobacteraceae bacterium]
MPPQLLRLFVSPLIILLSPLSAQPIDRQALVRRHNPVLRAADPWAPLSVGNGEFAFTADVTGLQSFPDFYRDFIPLSTLSQWGWHSFPNPAGYRLEQTFEPYDTAGRPVQYPTNIRTPAAEWLRQNPHRLGLARIGFDLEMDSRPAAIKDLQAIEQRLDLWTGTLESRFTFAGQPFEVRTWVHPVRDLLAVRIMRTGAASPPVRIRIEFPYGSGVHTGEPADWTSPGRHATRIRASSRSDALLERSLDETRYFTRLRWSGSGTLRRDADHAFVLEFSGNRAEFTAEFSLNPPAAATPSVEETAAASRRYWARFWRSGGAIDLSQSADPRAKELERRIVLSQYLAAIQCSGSMPPQETGLAFNSWFGKFHLEMHWWHAAHFPLWGRPELLEKSLPWYRRIAPLARETAARQGYRGLRWPKMVGPDGRESPSAIGPLLVWQQPHLIHLLELVYRVRKDDRLLRQWIDLVAETADFMASFARLDPGKNRYVLGPPLIPAQELHPPRTTFNPAFELEYWRWGLATAQIWRERLGLTRRRDWDDVLSRLSPLPVVGGLYVNAESDPETFRDPSKRRDHPSLLGALGLLPGGMADSETMRRTLLKVRETWQWEHTWGWDYPLAAMTAARVGEPALAIEFLLMDTPKNRYHPNGHNYQRPGLTIYLPGNGGLLAAAAMMAAGWDGAPARHAPGFPNDGRWTVRWEGLHKLP